MLEIGCSVSKYVLFYREILFHADVIPGTYSKTKKLFSKPVGSTGRRAAYLPTPGFTLLYQ
jgi:hypothetical protein